MKKLLDSRKKSKEDKSLADLMDLIGRRKSNYDRRQKGDFIVSASAQTILTKLKNKGKLLPDGGNYKTMDGRSLLRAYKGKSQTVWVDPDKKVWYPTLLDAYYEDCCKSIVKTNCKIYY